MAAAEIGLASRSGQFSPEGTEYASLTLERFLDQGLETMTSRRKRGSYGETRMSKQRKRLKLKDCYQKPPVVMPECKAESEDVCRALYCPRQRKRLAYCPWARATHHDQPRAKGMCGAPKSARADCGNVGINWKR